MDSLRGYQRTRGRGEIGEIPLISTEDFAHDMTGEMADDSSDAPARRQKQPTRGIICGIIWLVVWNMTLYDFYDFPFSWECHNPN